jgi:hypothetical protein
MLEGETYVLEAVRDILRKKLSLQDHECDVEPDEQIPAIANDLYFAVIPAGFELGPNYRPSSGVYDILHGFQVYVIQRASEVARDKRRSISMQRQCGLNSQLSRVIQALDRQMDLISYANLLLRTDFPTAQPFITAAQITRVDAKPKMVNSDTYGGAMAANKGTTPYVAMARSIYFGRMQRIQTIAQLTPAEVVA